MSFFAGASTAGSLDLDRKRAGVMVSSDEMEAATACDVPFVRRVGERGSRSTTLTNVMAGRTAVTIVALYLSVSAMTWPRLHLRRAPSQAEQYARQQQFWIHVLRLHQNPQRDSNNRITEHGNTPHADSITQ